AAPPGLTGLARCTGAGAELARVAQVATGGTVAVVAVAPRKTVTCLPLRRLRRGRYRCTSRSQAHAERGRDGGQTPDTSPEPSHFENPLRSLSSPPAADASCLGP